jgi:hypothetical protein
VFEPSLQTTRIATPDFLALSFSRFNTCGAREGHYILDFIHENKSEVQPDTIHADTQGIAFFWRAARPPFACRRWPRQFRDKLQLGVREQKISGELLAEVEILNREVRHGADFGGEHWPGAGRDQRPEASHLARG